MIRRCVVALLAAVLAALMLLATATPGGALEPAAAPGAPLLPLWEVTRFDRPDGVTYLLAELGFGRLPVEQLDPTLARVFSAADRLVVPVDDLREGFGPQVERASDELRHLRGGRLDQLLPPATYAELRTMLTMAGWQPEALATSRPWYAQGWVEWSFYEGRGFDLANALHRALLSRARGRIPIVELEDVKSPFASASSLDDRTAAAVLRYTIEHKERLSRMPVLFERAIASGELGEVNAEIERQRREEPAFARAWQLLIEQPARRYADRLFELAGERGVQLVVLPIGLVLGERGVPQLLKGFGLDVRRLSRGERPQPQARVAAGFPGALAHDPSNLLREPAPASSLQFRRFTPLGPEGMRSGEMDALGCPPCLVLSIASSDAQPAGSQRGLAQSDPLFTLEPRDVTEALIVDSTQPGNLQAATFGLVLVLSDDARPRVASHAFDRDPGERVELLAASLPGASQGYAALIHTRGIMLALPTREEALDVAARLGLASHSR